MYISLVEIQKEIEFGDIITYEDEACLVVNGTEFITGNYPVLLVNLARSKVVNAYQNLDYLNLSPYKLRAKESDVEIVFREGAK